MSLSTTFRPAFGPPRQRPVSTVALVLSLRACPSSNRGSTDTTALLEHLARLGFDVGAAWYVATGNLLIELAVAVWTANAIIVDLRRLSRLSSPRTALATAFSSTPRISHATTAT